MKATLSFNLPEEDEEYMGAVKGPRLRSACGEFAQWMRNRHKHVPLSSLANDELGIVRDMFWEMCGDYLAE